MDTKEAIEIKKAIKFLKNIKNNMYYPPEDKDKNIDKIIALLQQGEKYRQMWEDLGNIYKNIGCEDYIDYYNMTTTLNMKNLKQKYFPKESNQDYKEGEE